MGYSKKILIVTAALMQKKSDQNIEGIRVIKLCIDDLKIV